jgi:hypothetical protein
MFWPERIAAIDTENLHICAPAGSLTVLPLPENARPGASIGAIAALAIEHHVRQLWIHPSWWKAARLPKRFPANPHEGFPHPWASPETLSADWHMFKPIGHLKPWMRFYRKGARGSIVLAVPQLEDRTDWTTARTATDLLEALLLLRNLLGTRYQSSPGSYFRSVIEHSRKRGSFEAEIAPDAFPAPWREKPDIAPAMAWERPLLPDELQHRYALCLPV